MADKEELGKLLQFPIHKLDEAAHESASVPEVIDDEATAYMEIYNYYRDIFLAKALELSNNDGALIEFNPLEKAIEFNGISNMPNDMNRHIKLGDFLAELYESVNNFRMTTPIVIYAMTLSRHSGPDLFHLVRYEGLLQDLVKDKSYTNWDEVMNSDVDVDEEPTYMPAEFYFSLLPCVQDNDGTWRMKSGSMAVDVPFSQILAIFHAKSPSPQPRQV